METHSTRIRQRREKVLQDWSDSQNIILVPSGLPVPIAGTDQFHDFHAHSEHVYLAGAHFPRSVLTYSKDSDWTLFVHVADLEESIWTGEGEPLSAITKRVGMEVQPLSDLKSWLEKSRGMPVCLIGNKDFEDSPEQYDLSDWRSLEATIDYELSESLSQLVSEKRRAKDASELARMEKAAQITYSGHMAGLTKAHVGMTERELQIEIESTFYMAGASRTAYGSIVGSGSNASILHFAPTKKKFRSNEIILVDAGAEFEGYASDVTRTYPVGEKFTGIQKNIYELVLSVQESAIQKIKPGVEYKELHLNASLEIASGLKDLGILKGTPEGLVEQDAQAIFFPHGLGHLLGLATHDAGGCLEGRLPSERASLRNLRADLPLEENYVVTIEPGIYFIKTLLEDSQTRAIHKETVAWSVVDQLKDFGGIRIEDDIVVTADGGKVIGPMVPKTINEIESIRAAALQS